MPVSSHFAALGLERFVAAHELRESEVGDFDVVCRVNCHTNKHNSSATKSSLRAHINHIICTVFVPSCVHKRLVHCASASVALVDDCVVLRRSRTALEFS